MSEELKRCPFCGSQVDLMTLFTGIKMFYCRNHAGCGAIVSFDNKKCNDEKGEAEKIKAWNRRWKDERSD